jgi:hypothetical protein
MRRFDVAHIVHFDLAFEKIRVRFVADGDEDSLAIESTLFSSFDISQVDSGYALLVGAQDPLNGRVPDEFNLIVAKRFVLHDLRRSQFVRR